MFETLRSILESKKHVHSSKDTQIIKGCDYWVMSEDDEALSLGTADLEVHFRVTPGSFTDQPYGEGHAREYHGPEVFIEKICLVDDTNMYDEDGEVTGQMDAGTDLLQKSWWQADWTDKIIDALEF